MFHTLVVIGLAMFAIGHISRIHNNKNFNLNKKDN